MADVDVTFGAKIDELIGKIDQVNSNIAGIGQQAKDTTSFFDGLGKGILQALSVDAVYRFVDAMGRLGEEAEKSAARLGISTQAVGEMQAIAKIAGIEFDSLQSGIERISLGVQRASRDSFDPGAVALRNLGLNAKDLIGLPTEQYFQKLAGAVEKFNPSLNLTNTLMQIGGRGVAQMIPLLQKGEAGYRALQEQIRATGVATKEQVASFAATDDALDILKLSIQGLGVQIYSSLQPGIDGVIKSLTQLVQWFITSTKEGGLFGKMMDGIGFVAKAAASAIASMVAIVVALAEAVQMFVTIPFKGMEALTDFQKNVEKVASGLKTTLQDIWRVPATVTVTKPGQDMGGLNLNGKEQIRAQQEALEAQRFIEQQRLQRARQQYDQLVGLERITASEGVRLNRQKTEEIYQTELALLERQKALWPQKSLEHERINRQIVQLEQKHITEMQQLNFQLVNTLKNQYMEFFNSLQSAWNSQLRGLLAGTTTWKQAFKNILADMLIDFIQWGQKKLFIYIAGEAAETQAKAAGTAARVGLAETEASASLFSVLAKALKSIMTSVGETFAGVTAFLSPVMGPAAPAAGAAVAAGVSSTALGMLPSFDIGAWQLPSDTIARVHKDEMIIPASPAQAIRDGAFGGGLQIGTISLVAQGRVTREELRSHAKTIIDMLKNAQRNNEFAKKSQL